MSIQTIPVELLAIILNQTYHKISRLVCHAWNTCLLRHSSSHELDREHYLCAIVDDDNPDLLEWVLKQGETPCPGSFCNATKPNRGRELSMLLDACDLQLSDNGYCVLKSAITNDNVEALICLGRCEWPSCFDAGEQAAHEGSLNALEWLIDNKYIELSIELPMWAAIGEQLHILEWLKGRHCPWNEFLLACATMRDKLKSVKWLIENNWVCYRDPHNMFVGRPNEESETYIWLKANGYV